MDREAATVPSRHVLSDLAEMTKCLPVSDRDEITNFFSASEGFTDLLQSLDGWKGRLPQCQASMNSLTFCQCQRVVHWAARYNIWFLIKMTPKGVVFYVLCSDGLADLLQSHDGLTWRLPQCQANMPS